MSKYLDLTGLTYFLNKLKTYISGAHVATADKSSGLYWGKVDGTSTNTAFTATIPGITAYYEGLTVILKNGVATSTTNCTLNINNLGALPIYPSTSSTRVSSAWSSAYTMIFVYTENKITGTPCWEMQYGMAYSNSIGYQVRTNSTNLPASDKFYRYRLLFTSADGTKYVPANTSTSTNGTASRTTNTTPIDPFGPIVYYGTTSAVSAGSRPSATYLWQQYVVTLGYSFNNTGAALTLTAHKPVYLKCTPQADGSAVMDYFTQSLPSTEDGKIYIFLGVAVDETTMELNIAHPVYYYKNSAIRLWANTAGSSGAVVSVNSVSPDGNGNVALTASDVGAKPASYSAPVDSVNGQTGAVVLTAADVGAKPSTYSAPVDSVNTKTGAVVLTASDVGALPDTYAAPVDSVNGKTGTVVLTSTDVACVREKSVEATTSAIGWYRAIEYDAYDSYSALGYSGEIVTINIVETSAVSSQHSIKLVLSYNNIKFIDETSHGANNIVDKIRYTVNGSKGYIDIHVATATEIIINVRFSVASRDYAQFNFLSKTLASVADAPSGETVMTTYNLTAKVPDAGTSYEKREDGTLIQWGVVTNTANGYRTVQFEVPFVDDTYVVTASARYSSSYTSLSHRCIPQKSGLTGVVINFKQLASTASYTGTDALGDWIAIGRWK